MRLLSILLFLCFSAASPANETIGIDSTNSHASFAVRMLLRSEITGRMDELHGTLSMDDSGHARALISIDAVQMHTNKPRYKAMLRSEEFFDTAHYPTIHFRSDVFAAQSLRDGGEIEGTLTLRGISRAVRFTLLPAQCESAQITDCLVRVHGTIKRSDYGMDAHNVMVGDLVQLRLSIRLEKAQSMIPGS